MNRKIKQKCRMTQRDRFKICASLETGTIPGSGSGDKTANNTADILMTHDRNFIINPQSLKTENRC